MATYVRRLDHLRQLPAGTQISVRGKNSTFLFEKTPQGWRDGGAVGRLNYRGFGAGAPMDAGYTSDEELYNLIQTLPTTQDKRALIHER